MSYTKNRKPLSSFTYSDGTTVITWRKRHDQNCNIKCPCCECSCGAVTYEQPAGGEQE